MKTGILVSLAALALTVFAVSEAQGKNGKLLKVRLFGSSFTTSSQDDGTPTPVTDAFTSYQSGIAKGSGSPLVSAQTVTEAAHADARCPVELPVGNDLTTSFVWTYKDGSILSGTSGAGSFFCSDGVVFVGELLGIITGGDGRFEGATGTWVGTARIENSRLTAEFSVDLD